MVIAVDWGAAEAWRMSAVLDMRAEIGDLE
jgi:hypothetical protein